MCSKRIFSMSLSLIYQDDNITESSARIPKENDGTKHYKDYCIRKY